jgi:hypothetical protein
MITEPVDMLVTNGADELAALLEITCTFRLRPPPKPRLFTRRPYDSKSYRTPRKLASFHRRAFSEGTQMAVSRPNRGSGALAGGHF